MPITTAYKRCIMTLKARNMEERHQKENHFEDDVSAEDDTTARDHETDSLSTKQELCFSVGHVQNDLQAFAALSYLLVFLTKVVGLQNQSTGTIFLVAQVTDGVLSPLLGYLCDRYEFPGLARFGKRKSWHIFGVMILLCFSPFLFVPCLPCYGILPGTRRESVAVVYYSIVVIAIHFGFAAVQISHLALLPDIARKPSHHVKLNSMRTAWTFISGMLVYGIFWLLLGKSSGNKLSSEDGEEFMYLGFIIVGVGFTFTIIFYSGVNENKIKQNQAFPRASINGSTINRGYQHDEHSNQNREQDAVVTPIQRENSQERHPANRESDLEGIPHVTPSGTPTNQSGHHCPNKSPVNGLAIPAAPRVPVQNGQQQNHPSRNSSSIKTKMKRWFKTPQFYLVGFVYMCSRIVVNISSAYFPFYLEEALDFEKEAIAYFPLLVLVASTAFSLVAKKIASYWNSHVAYCIAALMAIATYVWLYIQPIDSRNAIYGASLLMGGGSSMMLVTALTMVAVMIDSTDKTTGAFVYGFMSLTDKIANGIVVKVVQKLKPEKSGEYIRLAFPLVTSTAAFLSMLVVIVLFIVQRKDTKQNDHKRHVNGAVVFDDAALDSAASNDGLNDSFDTRL